MLSTKKTLIFKYFLHDNHNMSDFWIRTNYLIKLQNKTQRGLAIECGLSERKIENQSSADRIPDAIEAVKIAEALNTTVEFLVTGIDRNEDHKQLLELKAKLADMLLTK